MNSSLHPIIRAGVALGLISLTSIVKGEFTSTIMSPMQGFPARSQSGGGVAAHEGFAVFGFAGTRSAYVLRYRAGEDGWGFFSSLTASGMSGNACRSVAISEEGVALADDAGTRNVYCFDLETGTPAFVDKLVVAGSGSSAPTKLAMSDSLLAASSGLAVQIFEKANNHWTLKTTVAMDLSDGSIKNLALNGSRLVVGLANKVAVYEASSGAWSKTATLTAPQGVSGFGDTVGVSSSQIVVGSYSGGHVYRLSGSVWTAAEVVTTRLLGRAAQVAINDDTLAVESGSTVGFTLRRWSGTAWVTAPSSPTSRIGESVSGAFGGLALGQGMVVAPAANGETYCMLQQPDGWARAERAWLARFQPGFGSQPATDGNVLAVVEPVGAGVLHIAGADVFPGAVNVYGRTVVGKWAFERRINLFSEPDRQLSRIDPWEPPGIDPTERRANRTDRVAVSGDWLAASSGNKVFLHRRDGGAWTRAQVITVPRKSPGSISAIDRANSMTVAKVALSGSTLAVSLRYEKVRIYQLGKTGTWDLEHELPCEDACSLATNGDSLMLASPASVGFINAKPAGVVRTFRRVNGRWISTGNIGNPAPQAGDGFGQDVAMDGPNAIVGGFDSVVFYTQTSTGWILKSLFTAPFPTEIDRATSLFSSVCLKGSLAGFLYPFSTITANIIAGPLPSPTAYLPGLFKRGADGRWVDGSKRSSAGAVMSVMASAVSDGEQPWFAGASPSSLTIRRLAAEPSVFVDQVSDSSKLLNAQALLVGTLRVGQSITKKFLVRNDGLVAARGLTLRVPSPANVDVEVLTQPVTLLEPGGSTSFELKITGKVEGVFYPSVTLDDDDPDTSSLLTFSVQGTVSDAPVAVSVSQSSELLAIYLDDYWGRTLELQADVTAPAPLQLQWYKNGVALRGENHPVFRKTVSQLSDAGLYQLKVLSAGQTYSSAGQPIVVAAKSRQGVQVLEGRSVALTSPIQGPPGTRFWWARDDANFTGPLVEGPHYSGTRTQRLLINPAESRDSTGFILYAGVGDNQVPISTTDLTVVLRPQIKTTTLGPWLALTSIQAVIETNVPCFGIYADGLPPGLTLNPQTGVLSGMVRLPGVHNVRLRAYGDAGFGAAVTIPIQITPLNFGGAASYHGLLVPSVANNNLGGSIDIQMTAAGTGTAVWTTSSRTFQGVVSVENDGTNNAAVWLSYRTLDGTSIRDPLIYDPQGLTLIGSSESNYTPFMTTRRITDLGVILRQAGRYSCWFTPDVGDHIDDPAIPHGTSVASLFIDAKGMATMVGFASDGSAVSMSKPITSGAYGYLPVHLWTRAREGALSGWSFEPFEHGIASQPMTWLHLEQPEGARVANEPFARGFPSLPGNFTFSRYNAPAAGQPVFTYADRTPTSGLLGLEYRFVNVEPSDMEASPLTFTRAQTIVVGSTPRLVPVSFNVTASNGLFSGSLRLKHLDGTSELIEVHGIIDPPGDRGLGFFLAPTSQALRDRVAPVILGPKISDDLFMWVGAP
ncbi:MAG: hypothetical protein JNM99_15540 [Verrucomicrobiaceae bacterium]|nr:hypothetical protein [Verrucomicrobiaceae bacterium]